MKFNRKSLDRIETVISFLIAAVVTAVTWFTEEDGTFLNTNIEILGGAILAVYTSVKGTIEYFKSKSE